MEEKLLYFGNADGKYHAGDTLFLVWPEDADTDIWTAEIFHVVNDCRLPTELTADAIDRALMSGDLRADIPLHNLRCEAERLETYLRESLWKSNWPRIIIDGNKRRMAVIEKDELASPPFDKNAEITFFYDASSPLRLGDVPMTPEQMNELRGAYLPVYARRENEELRLGLEKTEDSRYCGVCGVPVNRSGDVSILEAVVQKKIDRYSDYLNGRVFCITIYEINVPNFNPESVRTSQDVEYLEDTGILISKKYEEDLYGSPSELREKAIKMLTCDDEELINRPSWN